MMVLEDPTWLEKMMAWNRRNRSMWSSQVNL